MVSPLLAHPFLPGLFTAATRCLAAFDPFELAGLEVVPAVLELAQNPLPGHAVLQLSDGLLHPIVPDDDLERAAQYGLADPPASFLMKRNIQTAIVFSQPGLFLLEDPG